MTSTHQQTKMENVMSKTVAVTSEYRNLPLAQLQESPTNPRRRFDARAMEELAASFTAQGVLQPLLVRAIETDKYEVIAGARRLRAAKLAGLNEVPVRVVELSDAAVRESQLTENLLREDVHPYEEALALSGLLHLEGAQYDVSSIASRLGKSPAYITTRIRLTELVPSLAEAFLADQIGVGHALEIAKLPQSQQEKAFDAAFRTVWNGGKESRVVLPLRDFAAWIEQNILLSLDSVPFDKNDAALVPEAGSCAECPKRTGFNALLFGEMSQRDQCTDAACLNNKVSRFVERQIGEKPKLVQITTAHGTRGDSAVLPRNRYVALQLTNPAKSKQPLSPNQKPCKHMAEAIVVDGTERGQTVKVCAEPSCAVHFADRTNKTPNPEQLAKEREQRRKEIEKQKLEITIRHRVLAEVLKNVGAPLDRADLVLAASTLLEKTEPLRREALARRHKMVDGSTSEVTYPQVQKGLARLLRQLDESGLSKLIVEIILLGSVESASQEETDALTAAARRHRVDVAKVRKTVEAEFVAKQAKTAAKQKQPVRKSTAKTSKAA
jgi:ParB family chromosome partitioning protein